MFIIESGLYVLFLLILVNGVVLYTANFFVRGATTCMTQAQITADNRCLYIVSGKIYDKGTRSSPHHGHPCGTDVTSVIPSDHTSAATSYLDPNYVADVCTASAPPPQPPSVPPSTAPSKPVAVPSPGCLGSCPSLAPSSSLVFPSSFPNSGQPGVGNNGGGSGSGGGFFSFFLQLFQLLFQVLLQLLGASHGNAGGGHK